MITIRKPLCFSEIGKKDNQEDYLFPQSSSFNDRIFILCDGMGGHDNGEVASRIAATTLGSFLQSYKDVSEETFLEGLSKAYDALDDIDTNSPKKPGTTLTCLCLNDENYLVAHIGDSRIYHIRPSLFNPKSGRGGILYQSEDHSLVNDLLKAGEITEEEARDFPQKNVITRAMQPHLEKRYKADVAVFDNIRAGDYFFLCCDGVLEQLSNEMLCSILAEANLTDEQKLAKIKAICDGQTRDNYSSWLIPIENVAISSSSLSSDVILATDESENENVIEINQVDNGNLKTISVIPGQSQPKSRNRSLLKLFTYTFAILAVLWSGYFACTYFKSERKPKKEVREIKKKPTIKRSTSSPDKKSDSGETVFIPFYPLSSEEIQTSPNDSSKSMTK